MADKEMQRPEGALLQKVIDSSGVHSRRSVADQVRLSEARVRQIINGYASAGRGQRVEVVAPADTLARIADALLISPEELEAAGRKDAADAMRALPKGDGRGYLLHQPEYEKAWKGMEDWMARASVSDVHPPTSALYLFTAGQLAEVLPRMVSALEDQIIRDLSEGLSHERHAPSITRAGDARPVARDGIVAFTSPEEPEASSQVGDNKSTKDHP